MATVAQHSMHAKPWKLSGQTLALAAAIAASLLVASYVLVFHDDGALSAAAGTRSKLRLADIPFDGEQAYQYLKEICALGGRTSASPGMQAQQKMLAEYFGKLGGKVRYQKFRVRHPSTGEAVPMANLIVEWHPERKERILLCTHYDTRPFPDQDPRNPRGPFVGANDGASGTALLMELGRHMAELPGELGVDFVFFDGEEYIFEEGRDPYFVGSEYFATAYANQQADAPRYRQAVLLDMVGDADLTIYPDRRTLSWEDSRPLVDEIWGTAARLGVVEFMTGHAFDVLDDHIKLHDIGKIPSCDIIDFRYPHWHTQGDLPNRCSALSLAKVGWVIEEWLKRAVAKP